MILGQVVRANARRNASTSISNRDYCGRGADQSGDRRGDQSGDRRGDLITGDRSGDRSRDESGHRIKGRREFNFYNLLASTAYHRRYPSRERLPFIIHTPDGLPAASRTRQWPLHEHTSSSSQSTSRQLGRTNARRNASTSFLNRDYWDRGGDQSGDLLTGDRSRDESGHRIRGRREYNVYSHLLASTVVRPSNEAMEHRSPAYRLTGTRHHSLRDERVRRGYNVNSGIDVAQNHYSQTLGYLMTGTSAPPPWGSPNRSLESDLPPRYEDAIPPSYAEAISKLEYVVPTYI